MSRMSPKTTSVASRYLAACSAQPESTALMTIQSDSTRPFCPPTMEWNDPAEHGDDIIQYYQQQSRSTASSPSRSRTPSRRDSAPDNCACGSPFRRSSFFRATQPAKNHHRGGDDTSLTQTNSSLTSSRKTPSSRGSGIAPSTTGGHHADGSSSIESTERISDRSSTPPLMDEDEHYEPRDKSPASSWRRRLEGTANTKSPSRSRGTGDNSWIKKKAPARQLGRSPPRGRTPPRPLTAEAIKERMQPSLDPATAPTEIMMNLRKARPSPDQMTTVSGAATEIITNRATDRRSRQLDDRDGAFPRFNTEDARGLPPPSSRGTSAQRPQPVYPQKPVDINSLISASSNDDSNMTPMNNAPVADFPVGRLGRHVNGKSAEQQHKRKAGDDSRASAGDNSSFQTKSITSSVGVETGEHHFSKPPAALKSVFAGQGDLVRRNVQERYGFGALKKVEEPESEEIEEPPPPLTTPRQSPTEDDHNQTLLAEDKKAKKVCPTRDASNPFVVKYDVKTSPPSERKLYPTGSAQSGGSSGGWTPVPLSSASGIESADFPLDPNATLQLDGSKQLLQPVFSPDRVDMDEQSPLAKWSSNISPILPAPPVESSEDENGPPRIMRVTEKAAFDVSPPTASSVAQVLASGSARRAALFQRRKSSVLVSKESTEDRKESMLALMSNSGQITGPANKAATTAAPTQAETRESVHHHDMDPTEQPTKPKHAWPISIAVPTTRPDDTVEISQKQDEVEAARRSAPAAAHLEAEVVQSAPGSHIGAPTSSARAGSAIDSEINSLTHRQLLVMAAHLAATADDVAPAERYASRHGIIGAARVDIDNVSSGEIQSMRSLLESSLGSFTSRDDDTVGEQSVQSILSNLAGKPENEVAAAVEELARVSRMRAMFEPQKAPSAKKKTFHGNSTLKDAFSVFEKSGPEQTSSQSIRTSSANAKPADANLKSKRQQALVISESPGEGGGKLQSSRAVFEKHTQQRPITPTKTVPKLGGKSKKAAVKESKTRDSVAIPDSQPTNPWKAQMMARKGRSTTPEKNALSKDATEKPEGAKPRIDERPSSLHNRWKAQMMERSKPTLASAKESKAGPVGREGVNISTEAQSTLASSTSAIAPHNPWKAQMLDRSKQSPAKERNVAEPSAKHFETQKPGSESTARPVSPHNRWKAQMTERSKGPVTPTKELVSGAAPQSTAPHVSPHNRWKAQMLERSKRPVTKERDLGEKKPQPEVTVPPISPHNRWKEQMREQSKRELTPTKERVTASKVGQKDPEPTSSEVIAPPISPHNRRKAQMTERTKAEKSPVQSYRKATRLCAPAEPSAAVSSNPWKSQMVTRSTRCSPTVATTGHEADGTAAREQEGDHKDTSQHSQAVVSSVPPQNQWKKPSSNTPCTEAGVESSSAAVEVARGEKAGKSIAERIKAFKAQQISDSKVPPNKSPPCASPTWKRKQASNVPLADSGGAITPTKGPALASRSEDSPSTVASTPWKDSPESKFRSPHVAPSPSSSAAVTSPDTPEKASRNLAPSPEPRTPVQSADDTPRSPYPSVRDRISAFSASPKTPPTKSPRAQAPGVKSPSDSEGGAALSSTAETNKGTGRGLAPPPDNTKSEIVKDVDKDPVDTRQKLDVPKKSGDVGGVKSTIYVSKKPLLKPGNDRPPIDPSGSKTESEYEDGVTLDLSIAEVSALTNPTCLQSKGDLNDLSTGSSDNGTEDKSSGVDVTEEKRPSEASSSQMSEAAAPLIARMLYSRSDASTASMRMSRADPRTTSIDEEAPQETAWDLNNVASTFLASESTTKTAFGFQSLEADDWQPFQSSPWDKEASGQWEAPVDDKFFNKLAAEGSRSPVRQRHASPSRSRASTPKQANTKYTSSRAPVPANDLPHDLFLPSDTSGMPAGAVFHRTHPKTTQSEPGHTSGSDTSNGLSRHAALMMKLKSLKESRIRRHAAGSFHPSATVHPTDKVPPRPSSTGSALTPRLYSGKGLAACMPYPGPDQNSIGDDEHSASTKSSTRFGGIKFDEVCLELD